MFLWKLYNKYYYNIYSRRNKYFRPYGINIIIFFSLEHTFCNSYSIWNLDYYSSTLLGFFFLGGGSCHVPKFLFAPPFESAPVIYIWWRRKRWHCLYISNLLYINMEFPNFFQTDQLNLVHSGFPSLNF